MHFYKSDSYRILNIYPIQEDVLVDIKKDIRHDNVKSFNQHLAELERLIQDDSTLRERLATSGVLCSAALLGSVSVMDTLIQKGVGKALLQEEEQ